MTTKEQVLKILNDNNGLFLSGQEIADQIYVTRASVWKAIKALEKDGYQIDAVTNKGYRLKKNVDLIDTSFIQKSISKSWKKTKVLYYDEIDSTNDEAKRLAINTKEDLIIIAGKQSNGHGRKGRDFYSPENTGLYFSVLIHTNNNISSSDGITAIAASAAAVAIDNVIFNNTDTTKIKWVNDIFYKEKKVAGILSEACNYMEDEESNYIIIGFGINVYEPEYGFPKNIKKTAGFLMPNVSQNESKKSKLVAAIVNQLTALSKSKDTALNIYKSKSMLIGNYVKINSYNKDANSKPYAKVTGINSKFHLLVKYDNGKKEELSSGEVSVVKY